MTTGRLIVSLTGKELTGADKQVIQHKNTGGVILFTRNFTDKAALKNLVGEIQALAIKAGKLNGLPVFVDHEGGRVQRFKKNGFTELPTAKSLGDGYVVNPATEEERNKNIELLAQAKKYGKLMAGELADVGIISLAPVLDLDKGNEAISKWGRSFHQEPSAGAALAAAFIDGMLEGNMAATGKHFPGHGEKIGDSHTTQPVDTREFNVIWEQDLLPFRQLIDAKKLAAVMPAHILYPAVDSTNIASMSSKWLNEILRGLLKFDGIIISDCLSMKGVDAKSELTNLDKVKAALVCNDLALLCNVTPEEFLAVLDGMADNYPMSEATEIRYNAWVGKSQAVRLELAEKFLPKPVIFSDPRPLAAQELELPVAASEQKINPEHRVKVS